MGRTAPGGARETRAERALHEVPARAERAPGEVPADRARAGRGDSWAGSGPWDGRAARGRAAIAPAPGTGGAAGDCAAPQRPTASMATIGPCHVVGSTPTAAGAGRWARRGRRAATTCRMGGAGRARICVRARLFVPVATLRSHTTAAAPPRIFCTPRRYRHMRLRSRPGANGGRPVGAGCRVTAIAGDGLCAPPSAHGCSCRCSRSRCCGGRRGDTCGLNRRNTLRVEMVALNVTVTRRVQEFHW